MLLLLLLPVLSRAPTKTCHPERSSLRTLQAAQSKDPDTSLLPKPIAPFNQQRPMSSSRQSHQHNRYLNQPIPHLSRTHPRSCFTNSNYKKSLPPQQPPPHRIPHPTPHLSLRQIIQRSLPLNIPLIRISPQLHQARNQPRHPRVPRRNHQRSNAPIILPIHIHSHRRQHPHLRIRMLRRRSRRKHRRLALYDFSSAFARAFNKIATASGGPACAAYISAVHPLLSTAFKSSEVSATISASSEVFGAPAHPHQPRHPSLRRCQIHPQPIISKSLLRRLPMPPLMRIRHPVDIIRHRQQQRWRRPPRILHPLTLPRNRQRNHRRPAIPRPLRVPRAKHPKPLPRDPLHQLPRRNHIDHSRRTPLHHYKPLPHPRHPPIPTNPHRISRTSLPTSHPPQLNKVRRRSHRTAITRRHRRRTTLPHRPRHRRPPHPLPPQIARQSKTKKHPPRNHRRHLCSKISNIRAIQRSTIRNFYGYYLIKTESYPPKNEVLLLQTPITIDRSYSHLLGSAVNCATTT